MDSPFSVEVTPDWEGLLSCIKRAGTPGRTHFVELFLDYEIQNVIADRYGVLEGLDPDDVRYREKREIAIQSFLGYDYVRVGVDDFPMPVDRSVTADTADMGHVGGRVYMDEHRGPITNWDEFERYPWPDPDAFRTTALEWHEKNLPDGMCIIGSADLPFCDHLWLMGYETLCLSLYDQRDLVAAIADRLMQIFRVAVGKVLQFDRVKMVWGCTDMGFRTSTMISPDDLREFVLPRHRVMTEMAHAAGRPYSLHACGNLEAIMEDLIEDVKIDAKHSFEDAILDVRDANDRYGDRLALLGGIDVDFLCRAAASDVRMRVRDTLEKCLPGGGYCLGTGNSVANYIPLENYLAMLDEGRKFCA